MPERHATIKANFTKRGLAALEPRAKKYHVFDTQVRGLALRITPAGAKTFILSRKIHGQKEELTLGRFPDLSVEQARGKASDLNSRIASGQNPAKAVRAQRHSENATLGELFRRYLEEHALPHKKPKSIKEDKGIFSRYLERQWAKRRIKNITRNDVAALHLKVGETAGRFAANRLHALLRMLFNLATDWQLHEGPNPCIGVKLFKEPQRSRYIQPDEMPRFLSAVYQEQETFRDLFLILLLTGARVGNVRAMRFQDVDLNSGLWEIPDTKSSEPLAVPLVPEAVQILEARRSHYSHDTEWVFWGRDISKPVVGVQKAWRRTIARAGLENLRIHDARRTVGSWMAGANVSLSIIGKTLGHSTSAATEIYARLNVDPVRRALEELSDTMMKHGSGGVQSPS